MNDIKPTPFARLTIIVNLDEMPESDYLDEIMDKAKEYGSIEHAELEFLKTSIVDLRQRR